MMPSVSRVTIEKVPSSPVTAPQTTVESALESTATLAYATGTPFSSTTFPLQSSLAEAATAASSIIETNSIFFIFFVY